MCTPCMMYAMYDVSATRRYFVEVEKCRIISKLKIDSESFYISANTYMLYYYCEC